MNKRSLLNRGFFVLSIAAFLLSRPFVAKAQDQAADNTAANQLLNEGNYEAASQAFEQFVKNYPTSTIIADAQLKLAYTYMQLQQQDKAIENYQKLLDPPTPAEVTEMALGLLPQALSGKAAALPETDGQRQSTYEAAINAFNAFETKHPQSDLIENNRYSLAVCYYQTRQYDPAIEALRKNLRDFPKSESAQDSEYLLALMLATKASLTLSDNRTATAAAFPLFDESRKTLENIISRHTDLPLVSDAQFQLGEVLFSRAAYSEGVERTKMLTESMTAYRSVESNDVVLKEQQDKIDGLKGRQRQVLASQDKKAILRLQNLIGKETGKLEGIKTKGSQRIAAHLKMAQIFYQLSTPAQPRYDECRVLLDYLEPLAGDSEKKTILYFKTMTYALQINPEKAVAGYDSFMSQYKGDPLGENLPLAIGAIFTATNPPNPVKALEYFKTQVELYPNSPATAAALVEQAQAYSQLQQFDQAVKTYQDYIAGNPEKSQALRANLGLGEIFRNTSKFDEADAVYAKIQQTYADNPAAVMESTFWRAWILTQQQKFQEAMTAFAKFIAVYPNDPNLTPSAFFTLAQAQKGAGAAQTAIKTFQQLVEKFPKAPAAAASYFERRTIAMDANDVATADALMREFIEKYPGNEYLFNAYSNIAQNAIAQNKTQDAINVFYQFIDKNVQSPLVPAVLMQTSSLWGGITQTLGRYASLADADRETWKKALENSIGDAAKVIEKYPASPEVANAARSILDAQKQFVAASLKKNEDIETYFSQFAAKFDAAPQTKSKLLFTLASFIYERDKAKALAQMQAAYDPSLVYAPGDLDLYGGALIDEKKIDEAAKLFEKLAADYPNPPGVDPKQASLAVQEAQAIALFGKGRVEQAQGQTAAAAASFAQLKTLYPWSSKIFEANYGIAEGFYKEKKYKEAIELIEGIVRAQTATNELRAKSMVLGGKIRRDTGDLGAAIDFFIKTDYFYGGVPASAAEGLFLGSQSLEAQAPTFQKPEQKAEAIKRAKKYYQDLVTKYPDSPFVPQAQERLKALGA